MAPIIDIAVVRATDSFTVMYVRPSDDRPVPWEGTWDPGGRGPFKRLISDRVSDRRSTRLKDSSVGPAPWYWQTFPSFGARFEWHFVPKAGLEYPNGDAGLFGDTDGETGPELPVLAVRTYGRALRANEGHILLWGPRQRENDLLIETFALGELQQSVVTEPDEGRLWITTAKPTDHLTIPAELPAGRASGRFIAKAASTLGEVLLLADGPSRSHAASSIYAWTPATGTVDVMPQTWFNEGTADLGYEWITRVRRDPRTRHILGDGMRIPPFELDERGRWLRHRSTNGPWLLSLWWREFSRRRR
jgi:hypothetical protein